MTKPPKRRKWLRRLFGTAGVLLLLLVLAWVFRIPLFGGLIKGAITDALAEQGLVVEVDEIGGSFLTSFELRGFRVVDSSDQPMIAEASLDRVSARYSLFGLARNSDFWIEEVHIVGLRAVVDLDHEWRGTEEEAPPEEDSGSALPLIPGMVRIEGLSIEARTRREDALSAEEMVDRLVIEDARLEADAAEDGTISGGFGALAAFIRTGGGEHRADRPDASFEYRDGQLEVDGLTVNGIDHGRMLRVDLAKLENSRIDAELHLPLLSGGLNADVNLDLSGEFPSGRADLDLLKLDPTPLLRFLPDLPIRIEAIAGKIRASFPGDSAPGFETTDAELELTLEAPGYDQWSAGRIRIEGKVAEGVLEARGSLTEPDLAFTARLTSDEILHAEVDAQDLDLARIGVEVDTDQLEGSVTIEARAAGPLDALVFGASLEARAVSVGKYVVDTIRLRANGTPEEILVQSLEVLLGNDSIRVTDARVVPSAEPIEFAGTVEVSIAGLDPYREFLPPDLPADLDARIGLSVSTERGTPVAPDASVSARLDDVTVDGAHLRSVALEASIPTTEEILLESLEVMGGGGLPDLKLHGGRVVLGEETVRATVAEFEATHIEESLGQPIVCRNRGELVVETGPEATRVAVALDGEGALLSVNASIGPDGELDGAVELESINVSRALGLLPAAPDVQGVITGKILLGGTTDDPRAEVALDVDGLSFSSEDTGRIELDALELLARYGEDGAVLDKLMLTGKRGWSVEAAGSAGIDLAADDPTAGAPITGTMTIDDLPLDLAGVPPGLRAIAGQFGASLAVSGTLDDPSLTGKLTVEAKTIQIEDPALPEIRNLFIELSPEDLGPAGGAVRINAIRAEAEGVRLEASGLLAHKDGELLDPTLSLTVRDVDIAALVDRFEVDGRHAGSIELDLRILEGPTIQLEVRGEDLATSGRSLGKLDLLAEWREGTVTVHRGLLSQIRHAIEFGGTLPLDLSHSPPYGGIPGDRDISIDLRLDEFPLASLRLEREGIRNSGLLSLDLEVEGTLSSPAVRGEVRLEGGRIRMPGAPPVDDLEALIRFVNGKGAGAPHRVIIEKIEGKMGGGHLGLTGTVDISSEEVEHVDIALTARNAQLVRDGGVRLRADIDASIRGKPGTELQIGGRTIVRGLRYTENVGLLLEVLQSRPSLASLPLSDDPAMATTFLDMEVLIPSEAVLIRNDVLDAPLVGRLRIKGTAAIPRPAGFVRIPKGKLFLPTSTMKIERVSVVFKEAEPLRAHIDARTYARISGYTVFVEATGPADDLEIVLSSDPSLPEGDVLSLLTAGVTRSQLGVGSLGSMAATVLYRQIASSLSSDDGEDSALSDLADRVELELNSSPANAGALPTVYATVRTYEDWLFVRGGQDSPWNYSIDLVFRLKHR